jgi:hypothetical protein
LPVCPSSSLIANEDQQDQRSTEDSLIVMVGIYWKNKYKDCEGIVKEKRKADVHVKRN